MVYRSDAVAERLGMAYGDGSKFFGVRDGGERRFAASEESGDGGREGAAGTVGVRGRDTWFFEDVEMVAVEEEVSGVGERKVAAFDDDEFGAKAVDAAGGFFHGVQIVNREIGENAGFRGIWGENKG